jgi:hypothetical protein
MESQGPNQHKQSHDKSDKAWPDTGHVCQVLNTTLMTCIDIVHGGLGASWSARARVLRSGFNMIQPLLPCLRAYIH